MTFWLNTRFSCLAPRLSRQIYGDDILQAFFSMWRRLSTLGKKVMCRILGSECSTEFLECQKDSPDCHFLNTVAFQTDVSPRLYALIICNYLIGRLPYRWIDRVSSLQISSAGHVCESRSPVFFTHFASRFSLNL